MPKRKFSRKYASRKRARRAVFSRAGPLGRSIGSRRNTYKSRTGSYKKAINMHMFTRYGATTKAYDVTTAIDTETITWKFENIRAYTEFQSMYDRYRITHVQLQFTLVTNPDSTLNLNKDPAGAPLWQPTNWYPKLWYVKDYDDSSTIDIAAMKERANAKNFILKPDRIYKINVKPAILAKSYATALTDGYAPKWKQWVDMATTNVEHYGIKFIIDCQGQDPQDSYPFKIRVEEKYFFTCKDVL